ncbi:MULTISPECIES: type VI secretion system Vgr family protein [unclassified Variovorax]|uniref:type VI secretion system Vgr family protein n=1 Tax=unclassified Variovorax TaxID=663243 RepID=UPI0008C7927C|nr:MULTISPECIES: type VI secretion system tip protein TssI/VgrG [unclassified Variovorax]SEJ57528.1 type VI secretion system secreted protein VgrG [Variovorax sp. OK202]SFC62352.1 type VI secretion system secreted protein VgrG [Variovorax sp. OK212]
MPSGPARSVRVLSVSCAAMPVLGGQPALEPVRIEGEEQLGRLYRYTVTLATPEQAGYNERQAANVNIKQLVGETLTVHVLLDGRLGADGDRRHIGGLVTRVRFLRLENRRALYEAVIEPWLTLATRTSDYRIFQNKSVTDIVAEVLADYDFAHEIRTTRGYPAREFQVQYGESDYDFVSRLLHEWGLYYHFEHAESSHKLVIVDDMASHQPFANAAYQKVPFHGADDTVREEHCDRFNACETLQSGRWVTDDFDFKRPKARLQQVSAMPRKTSQSGLERYGWPGDYVVESEGEQLARTRMEESGSEGERANGSGNLRAVVPGCLLALERHPQNESNRQYLVTGARLWLQDIGDASEQQPFECRVDFEVIPTAKTYRAPAPDVPRPRTTGPQTAIVTGPAGREIWTDEYGRVKLSFHWNRYCSKDESSSCWVRVSSPWAGTNFGGIQIPRIGQEVIVDFEHGDPDRPIVTGRVYNADNMPPWDLPANATQSGLLTRSSEGATDANANALRFEDKKGAEQLWLHAERNQDIEVENDETHWVGHDRTKTVDHDETVHVKHDRTETVDHDETITVHNDRTETVDGNETITIHKNRTETVDLNETITVHKNRTETVDLDETIGIGMNRTERVGLNETIHIGEHRSVTVGGAKMETVALAKAETIGLAKALTIGLGYQVTVGAAMNTTVALMQTEQVGQSKRVNVGKTLTLQAGERIELVCGKSSLVMTSEGVVTINGSSFDFSASGPVQVTGKDIDLN